MVLGRPVTLWLGLAAAALNVLVVVFGVPLSDVQIATLDGFALALLAVVANEVDPTVPNLTPWGRSMTSSGSAALSIVTASSPTIPAAAVHSVQPVDTAPGADASVVDHE